MVIEGNHYFPVESLNKEYIKTSNTESYCPWKGTANYYDLEVESNTNKDAVWYYDDPSEMAKVIKGRVAFWKGVEVTK